jgi:acetoin utilization deacetylase AcuC-like enzyme
MCLFRYDAHVLDPLAGLQFTTDTFYMLSSSIKQLAKELCGGRSIFFLEGGYNLESLSSSVADTFRAFLDEPSLAAQFDDRGDAARRTDSEDQRGNSKCQEHPFTVRWRQVCNNPWL